MIRTHMNSSARFFWLIAAALTQVSCTLPSTSEYLDWSAEDYILVYEEGTGWKGIGGEETLTRIYTTPGSTAEDWTVTLDVTSLPIAVTFMSNTRWNPESIMDTEKRMLAKKGCDDPWLILHSDAASLLYERPEVNCPGYLHQYEIGRIVMGEWYAWWLRYRIRDSVLTDDEKLELINRLETANVVRMESL